MTDLDSKKSRKEEIQKDMQRTAAALSTSEVISRYGNASAEYIKGYTGIDPETGQVFDRSLKKIAGYKVNSDPANAAQNIKQQAGFSAEVAATSRDNAEATIERSKVRASRSEDLPQYGKNHNVVDRVQVLDGKIIEGSQSQMKFVGDRDGLFKKIAEDTQKGDAEFARYRSVKLELPSEQYEGAAELCREKAQELRKQAQKAGSNGAPPEVIDRLNSNADHYDRLSENIVDSGLSTKDAIYYREHPKMATARDIARTSHAAGLEGAKYGAIIGGSISLLTSAFAVAQGTQQLDEAAWGIATDTTKAAALGYSTAAVGSALKSGLQQSSNQALRTLAHTNAPALAVNICLSLSSSIKRYVTGEISEGQLLSEVGEKGAGMLSSGMMAAVGQLAIPIPFVGAAVGGMIGYTLSSFFYQSALEASVNLDLSRERLVRVKEIEAAARARITEERTAFETFVAKEIPVLQEETNRFFDRINTVNEGVDFLAKSINDYALFLGKKLQFETVSEFDGFMKTDQPLKL